MLKDRNIVIKKIGDRIYLPTVEPLDVEVPSNIPQKAYTMCRISNYVESTGTIYLTVLPDVVNERQFLIAMDVNSDALISTNVKKLIFDNLPAPFIYPATWGSDDLNGHDDVYEEKKRKYGPQEQASAQQVLNDPPEKSKEIQITDLTMELPIKDINFEKGKVTFSYYIHTVGRKVQFDIFNPFIKKEFDSIKNYFSRALGTKKFTISIHIESMEREIAAQSATSPQVSKIDGSLIEIVEDFYIEDSFLNHPEDEIFSLNEKAEEISRKTGSDQIGDANWLLNKLITKERTKHYFHLRYLSSKHMNEMFNIRITGKPISFIFMLPTGNGYSLVWETYSTDEATYVWKLNNLNLQQLQPLVRTLVERIKWLRRGNKMAYIRDKPDNFIRIEHDYSSDDFGFKKWKNLLEQSLN